MRLAEKNTESQDTRILDTRLRRYMELKEQIGLLEAEASEIRAELVHQGSCSTEHFVCIVTQKSRTNPPSLKSLIETYGEAVKGLCSESTYPEVKVSRKGSES